MTSQQAPQGQSPTIQAFPNYRGSNPSAAPHPRIAHQQAMQQQQQAPPVAGYLPKGGMFGQQQTWQQQAKSMAGNAAMGFGMGMFIGSSVSVLHVSKSNFSHLAD